MDNLKVYFKIAVALLITGSAILLISCKGPQVVEEEQNYESMMTQQVDSLVIIQSENGKKSYRFQTPLVESYEYAKPPYREFRKGIYIETYDSLGMVETTLIADYAIEFIDDQLWEAKGNVVGTNAKGEILETQQLFWNQRISKVYSNVDFKVTGNDGIVMVGTGFESDEQFDVWEGRNVRGQVPFDAEQNNAGGKTSTGRNSGATTSSPPPAPVAIGAPYPGPSRGRMIMPETMAPAVEHNNESGVEPLLIQENGEMETPVVLPQTIDPGPEQSVPDSVSL